MRQHHACQHLIERRLIDAAIWLRKDRKKLASHSPLQQQRLCFGVLLSLLLLNYHYLFVYVHGISSLVTDFPH